MALNYGDTVPGTVHLVDVQHDMDAKHAAGNTDIALVPAPSSDPEDPLNWNPRRKQKAIWMSYIFTLGLGISSSTHYSGNILAL